jgi:hypothetical protein
VDLVEQEASQDRQGDVDSAHTTYLYRGSTHRIESRAEQSHIYSRALFDSIDRHDSICLQR